MHAAHASVFFARAINTIQMSHSYLWQCGQLGALNNQNYPYTLKSRSLKSRSPLKLDQIAGSDCWLDHPLKAPLKSRAPLKVDQNAGPVQSTYKGRRAYVWINAYIYMYMCVC